MMKSVSKYFLFALAIVGALVSCGGNGSGSGQNGGNTDDGASSLWKMHNYPVSKVEVYNGDELIETFEYTYDVFNRVTSMVRTDEIGGNKLLDLKYKYLSPTEMRVEGRYYYTSSSRNVTVVIDPKENTVSYQGSWRGAWPMVTAFDADGTVVSTSVDSEFSATRGQYSSQLAYREKYTVSGGDVTAAEIGTSISAKGTSTTLKTAPTSAILELEYSADEDNQNFAVYLFPCELPVWYAKELPGNRHLVSRMTWRNGNVASPVSAKIAYQLDADGDIQSATRTDYSGTEVLLVRTYKFYY